jgi:hypothetical protein
MSFDADVYLRFPYPDELIQFVQNADIGFTETLLKYIDASGKKDSDIYNNARVSRQLFSKIRRTPNYMPSKPTVLAFACALELNMEHTQKLLATAGYTLNTSYTFDRIVTFCIQNKIHNLFLVNKALSYYGQPNLGYEWKPSVNR